MRIYWKNNEGILSFKEKIGDFIIFSKNCIKMFYKISRDLVQSLIKILK